MVGPVPHTSAGVRKFPRNNADFWAYAQSGDTIAIEMPNGERPPRPGLAKIRLVPLFQRRRVELVASAAGPLLALFEQADVMSEGSTREENGVLYYYGSTSLLLRLPLDAPLPPPFVQALALDPHLRLRALRVARREATARAGEPLGPLHAEIQCGFVGWAKATLAFTVDVSARVLRATARPSQA